MAFPPTWGAFPPRQAQTGIPCHHCQHPLEVRRACQEVTLHCPQCGKVFPFQEYVQEMDDVLEHFMENVYCNRI